MSFTAHSWSPLPSSSAAAVMRLANVGHSCGCTAAAATATALFTSAVAPAAAQDDECTIISPSNVMSSSATRKPNTGDIITFTILRFQLTNSNSIIEPLFDTNGTLQLRLHHGNFLPGLHQLLSTMVLGETVKGSIIDAGFGPYNPQLVLQIDASQLHGVDISLVKIGTVLALGNGLEYRVTNIITTSTTAKDDDGDNDDDKVVVMWTLDGNHPSAGATYEVDVRLDAVEEAPSRWEYYDDKDAERKTSSSSKYSVATFGLGCFWGGELAYQRLPGVVSTSVGYTQGDKINPTYEEVCTGTTGHTEAIQVIYDPNVVSYRSLVHLALNRLGDNIYKQNQVGNDRGTQYRHGIYYHNEEQRQVAEELLSSWYEVAGKEVFTEVKKAEIFYMAEDYHQQYLLKGGQSAKKGASESIRCYG